VALTQLEHAIRRGRRAMHFAALCFGFSAGLAFAAGTVGGVAAGISTCLALLLAENYRSAFSESALNTAALLRRVSR
jgi:hypothetical protein